MISCPNVSQNTKVITSLMVRFYNMLFLFFLCRKEVVLLAQSMPQPAKVCISLNLFAGFNCSWPVSVFSRLLLETCTYVQVELSVRNELRQGKGADSSFLEGVKSPVSLLHRERSGKDVHCSIMVIFQLLHHLLVLYQVLAVLWL